jgi:hypothetical protein
MSSYEEVKAFGKTKFADPTAQQHFRQGQALQKPDMKTSLGVSNIPCHYNTQLKAMTTMTPQRRALLVGSPYKGLNGPKNDVDTMARVLGAQGFQIIRCLGQAATRDGIRKCWEELIVNTTDRSDTIVIYYSGHGGLVKSPQDVDVGAQGPGKHKFSTIPIHCADRFRSHNTGRFSRIA